MQNVIRIVFDTNTLVSAALSESSVSFLAFKKGLDIGRFLISEKTIDELSDVLFRPKFEKYVSFEKRQQFLIRYLKIVETIIPTETIIDCRDAKDNKFLEVAVSGKATILVSGDNDLLVLNPYRNIKILTSSQFLNWIN